ncbi:MAG: hypothetical protein HRT35_21895, partial [Algicola sp.]|nr:hypothetical protein [Algicola sp.]
MLNTNLTDGLVLGLSLADIPPDNILADLSDNGYNAEAMGDLTLVEDEIFGHCIEFDGSVEQYIKVEPFSDFPKRNLTVACWVKSDVTNKSGTPFSFANNDSSNAFVLFNIKDLEVNVNGASGGSTDVTFNDGQWQHIAVTWDKNSGTVTVFKNAEPLVTSGVLSTKSILPEGVVILGQEQDSIGGGFSASQAFKGQMAHVYIFDKVMDAQQLQLLMDANQLPPLAADIPLYVDTVGSNTILNTVNPDATADDGASAITLRVMNTQSVNTENPLTFSGQDNASSQFKLSFTDPVGNDWGLASKAQLSAIEAKLLYMEQEIPLSVTLQDERPVFSFNAPMPTLPPGQYFDIQLANIRTEQRSGVAHIYLDYSDIPGYQDGRFMVALEKTPIVHAAVGQTSHVGISQVGISHVGIGTMPDTDHRLKVAGDLAIHGQFKECADDGLYYDLVPTGTVVMWHNQRTGAFDEADLPKGWILCDGRQYTNVDGQTVGAPDLRGRFVVGVSDEYTHGATGGQDVVTLTEQQIPQHGHEVE